MDGATAIESEVAEPVRTEERYAYWVQLQFGFADKAKTFGVIFETSLPSIAAICEELKVTGMVYGQSLLTMPDGKGGRLITGREPIVIGVAGLICIQPQRKPCWEPAE